MDRPGLQWAEFSLTINVLSSIRASQPGELLTVSVACCGPGHWRWIEGLDYLRRGVSTPFLEVITPKDLLVDAKLLAVEAAERADKPDDGGGLFLLVQPSGSTRSWRDLLDAPVSGLRSCQTGSPAEVSGLHTGLAPEAGVVWLPGCSGWPLRSANSPGL